MAQLKIRIWPDPVLATVAEPVAEVEERHRTLVSNMFETMYAANGVGLAANQVGILERVLVIDLDPNGEAANDPELKRELESWGFSAPQAFINPEIVEAHGEILWQEGCLSVPGVTESVRRREEVVVRALNVRGQSFELRASGLFAVALQHEMDHLDGRVFVEYLSNLKRDLIKRKMDRLKADAIDDGVAAAAIL